MDITAAVLVCLLGSPAYPTREAAATALAAYADPPTVVLLLNHPDPEVRMRAGMLYEDLCWRELGRQIRRLGSCPFVDANPRWNYWTEYYRRRAEQWLYGRDPFLFPQGAPKWFKDALAFEYALADGLVDPFALGWLAARSNNYRHHREWEPKIGYTAP